MPGEGSTIVGEIKFLCAEALRPAIDPLIVHFQEGAGHEVAVSYANVGTIADRLRKGEVADLAVVSPEQWEYLRQEERLLPTMRFPLARIGIALAVRTGGAKPDVSSIVAFRQSLHSARSIVIIDPAKGSPSGVRAIKLFKQLGIATEIRPKKKLVAASEDVFKVLASGEAELGINQASEVSASPTVESAGPLPSEVRQYTLFVAGIPTIARQADAAEKLVEFLLSPIAAAEFKVREIDVA